MSVPRAPLHMQTTSPRRGRRVAALASLAAAALLEMTLSSPALALARPASDYDAAEPSVTSTTPLLQRLDGETQALYAQSRDGLVRVYLPPPQWALDLMGKDFSIRRWELQPNLPRQQELTDRITRAAGTNYLEAVITTQPAPGTAATTQPSAGGGAGAMPGGASPATQPVEAPGGFRLVPRGDGAFDLVGGGGSGGDRAVIDVAPRSIGFIFDDQGHVLIPYYIERETVDREPLTVACGNGTVAAAKFVGSDPATMLTILKLDRPTGTPVPLVGRRPADGALVLFLSSTGESARLQVWTGVQQETGVVMGVDGTVCGFLRQGQFLDAARVEPVVRQLIATGYIKRQRVGVYIREVLPADPLRREVPSLTDQPAVFVAKVVDGTPADRAGLRDGDLILAIGGETIGDPPSFGAAITPFQGRAAPFTILRDGKTLTLDVSLEYPKK